MICGENEYCQRDGHTCICPATGTSLLAGVPCRMSIGILTARLQLLKREQVRVQGLIRYMQSDIKKCGVRG